MTARSVSPMREASRQMPTAASEPVTTAMMVAETPITTLCQIALSHLSLVNSVS